MFAPVFCLLDLRTGHWPLEKGGMKQKNDNHHLDFIMNMTLIAAPTHIYVYFQLQVVTLFC